MAWRESNYESHMDDGPYGTEESWVPKDIWYEEDEMQDLDFEAAVVEARREPNEDGEYEAE